MIHDTEHVGAALRASLEAFEIGARRSGRTYRMVQAAGDRDRIVCSTRDEARRVERLVRDAGKKTKVTWLPADRNPADHLLRCEGKTIFDHGWVHRFYTEAIGHAEKHLEAIHVHLSTPEQKPRYTPKWEDSNAD